MASLNSRPIRFAAVGAIGFLVDASILQGAVLALHANLYVARAFSFLCAASVTWIANRKYTFRAKRVSGKLMSEWLSYLFASGIGGATNYVTFAFAIAVSQTIYAHPVIGVAIGSTAGMVINYTLYRNVVFQETQHSVSR